MRKSSKLRKTQKTKEEWFSSSIGLYIYLSWLFHAQTLKYTPCMLSALIRIIYETAMAPGPPYNNCRYYSLEGEGIRMRHIPHCRQVESQKAPGWYSLLTGSVFLLFLGVLDCDLLRSLSRMSSILSIVSWVGVALLMVLLVVLLLLVLVDVVLLMVLLEQLLM